MLDSMVHSMSSEDQVGYPLRDEDVSAFLQEFADSTLDGQRHRSVKQVLFICSTMDKLAQWLKECPLEDYNEACVAFGVWLKYVDPETNVSNRQKWIKEVTHQAMAWSAKSTDPASSSADQRPAKIKWPEEATHGVNDQGKEKTMMSSARTIDALKAGYAQAFLKLRMICFMFANDFKS